MARRRMKRWVKRELMYDALLVALGLAVAYPWEFPEIFLWSVLALLIPTGVAVAIVFIRGIIGSAQPEALRRRAQASPNAARHLHLP